MRDAYLDHRPHDQYPRASLVRGDGPYRVVSDADLDPVDPDPRPVGFTATPRPADKRPMLTDTESESDPTPEPVAPDPWTQWDGDQN